MQKPNSTAFDSMFYSIGLQLADPLVFSKFLISLNISNQSDDSLFQFVSDKLNCDFQLFTYNNITTYTPNGSITYSTLFPNLTPSLDLPEFDSIEINSSNQIRPTRASAINRQLPPNTRLDPIHRGKISIFKSFTGNFYSVTNESQFRYLNSDINYIKINDILRNFYSVSEDVSLGLDQNSSDLELFVAFDHIPCSEFRRLIKNIFNVVPIYLKRFYPDNSSLLCLNVIQKEDIFFLFAFLHQEVS